MKTFFAILITVFLAAGAFGQQSLGEIARQNRNKKKPTPAVNLDDDNMPRKSLLENEAPAKEDDKTAAGDEDKDSSGDKDARDSAKADKKTDLVKGIDAQKDEISHLQRELDILQREQKLRAAAYYGDAGTMLRDSAKYTEESKKQQEDIDAKKQALDAAQQKLSDLQEQARKSGLKTSE